MATSTLTPSGRLVFACPNCERKARSKRTAAGKRRRCRKCEEPFRIPFPAKDAAEGLTAVAAAAELSPAAAEAPAGKPQRVKRRPLNPSKAPRRRSRAQREALKAEAPSREATEDEAPRTDGSPYAPPAARLEGRPRRTRTGRKGEGKRDIAYERHLRAIGIWSVLGGILCFGLVGLMLLALPAMGGAPMQLLAILGGMCLLGSGYISSGVGLWAYQGWARIMTLALTAIGIAINLIQLVAQPGNIPNGLGVLFGIAWAVAILATVGSSRASRICTAQYRAKVAKSRASVPFYTSPFFYVPLGMVVLGVFLFVLALVAVLLTA